MKKNEKSNRQKEWIDYNKKVFREVLLMQQMYKVEDYDYLYMMPHVKKSFLRYNPN